MEVPSIITVLPLSPGGASESGMLVEAGMIRKLEPPIFTIEGPGSGSCPPVAAKNVVGLGITITGVLPMIWVTPTTFGGAPANGIVVGFDMVNAGTKGPPPSEWLIVPSRSGVLLESGFPSGFGVGLGPACELVGGGADTGREGGAVFVLLSPTCGGGDVGFCCTFGFTYIVFVLVSPPPAGIAIVGGNGEAVNDLVPPKHGLEITEGPPGRQPASPGYCALYAGLLTK